MLGADFPASYKTFSPSKGPSKRGMTRKRSSQNQLNFEADEIAPREFGGTGNDEMVDEGEEEVQEVERESREEVEEEEEEFPSSMRKSSRRLRLSLDEDKAEEQSASNGNSVDAPARRSGESYTAKLRREEESAMPRSQFVEDEAEEDGEEKLMGSLGIDDEEDDENQDDEELDEFVVDDVPDKERSSRSFHAFHASLEQEEDRVMEQMIKRVTEGDYSRDRLRAGGRLPRGLEWSNMEAPKHLEEDENDVEEEDMYDETEQELISARRRMREGALLRGSQAAVDPAVEGEAEAAEESPTVTSEDDEEEEKRKEKLRRSISIPLRKKKVCRSWLTISVILSASGRSRCIDV